MPAWITPLVTDLNDYLVAEQVTALRDEALATGQADPFAKIATDVVAKVRSFIASNPANRLDSDATTIPPELKLDVCYLIIGPMLGRLGIALTKDQVQQLDLAHSTLIALREKKLLVSQPLNPITPAVQSPVGVEQASAGTRLTTGLDNL